MNNKIYKAIIIVLSMCSITIRAMESESSASSNIIPIHISMPRNAGVRQSFVEDFDVTQDDPILLDSFENLIQGKKKKNDEYILARAITQTDDGAVVNYFDAHELNRALFGAYPYPVGYLKALENYRNPALNLPFQWLEYYECAPDKKVFTSMCAYAALRSTNPKKEEFWHHRFYANQNDNLKLAAMASNTVGFQYAHGEGVPIDYTKAMRLYEKAAQQKDNLGAAAAAKNNIGAMYKQGEGVPVDYTKAMRLFEEVAQQKDDLGVAAAAKNNIGAMYKQGEGVPVDYTKAMRLFEEVAQQKDNLGAAAIAKNNLEVMKASGCIANTK